MLLLLWAAPLPHKTFSDRECLGFGRPFPNGYGSGYSGLHLSRQRGTPHNGFNLPFALNLDVRQALGAEASFGTQMPPGLRAPSGSASSLDEATWGSSLPYSTAFVGDFSPTAAATAALPPLPLGGAQTFEAPLMTQGLAASLCQQQREQQQALAEQAAEHLSECEVDWGKRIASEVSAFLQDVTTG